MKLKMKKYTRPRKRNIDKKSVKDFLGKINFEVEFIEQPWRHVIAHGKFQGKDAVFKLASTLTTSPRTKNEYYWNEAVYLAPSKYRRNFTVPQNFASGEYKKLFYFIAQKFLSDPLIKRGSSELSNVSKNIKQIALATKEIEVLPIPQTSNFAISQNSKTKRPVGYGLLSSATQWASQTNLNLDKFLGILDKNKENIRTCVGQGDFVARQMYKIDGKIGIIDGEHAGIRGPLYYDVAYFYIRLTSENDAFDLGKQYLDEFYKLLSNEDKHTFWEQLKPVLIQRYIGNLWDNKSRSEVEKMQKLGKDILEDKIII